MVRIGLTGGIAAGKSVAAARCIELGAVVIDYDVLAREAVRPGTSTLSRIVTVFGPGVLHPDGSLDRAVLGGIAFRDHTALAALNQIVHPVVRQAAEHAQSLAVVECPDAVVIHDIPLLVEGGYAPSFDDIIVIDTPADIRYQRLLVHRKLSEQDAQLRIAAQVSDDVRRHYATVIFDGSGSPDDLRSQVDQWWHSQGYTNCHSRLSQG